jgi:hypothetical protein
MSGASPCAHFSKASPCFEDIGIEGGIGEGRTDVPLSKKNEEHEEKQVETGTNGSIDCVQPGRAADPWFLIPWFNRSRLKSTNDDDMTI